MAAEIEILRCETQLFFFRRPNFSSYWRYNLYRACVVNSITFTPWIDLILFLFSFDHVCRIIGLRLEISAASVSFPPPSFLLLARYYSGMNKYHHIRGLVDMMMMMIYDT